VTAGRGIPLTARQRDFLATYPDEVTVYVQEYHPTKGVKIYANSEYSDAHRQLWIPPEGFLGQPTVQLGEVTDDLDVLPETSHPTDEGENR
jgi:hypothetical protein